ncbi:hypothetical protein G6F46_003108 [Rhizopus delemar]|uniref:Uncharacterized protein n=3 Tax=Rhizopus TaxID=4842 RepID=I1BGI3_RHIO9|nr:hypothetical protein RO3G_00017 [Rhizopus delemar RA 99-880]KAG1464139.1 hypothetical protein G6F55_001960 [Rhizopus delemar]KAG1549024.1 hypothetical protein G6F51_003300 [Rhizopus arrhizus]KAG1500792.1 hypothetical protein G6F52_012521 [Rhizopus delemar]KAG1502169.1 hypothetical protein G6F54_002535 [Rhizopus delemar]|eukprot:EIE75313.1 hypothetical protein RO3G_00017 [Rhizopus delemar RA 99-880]
MNFVTLRKLNVRNQKINVTFPKIYDFKPDGYVDSVELIQRNIHKALATMNTLSSIGVNPSGFSKLLCTRFYAHIVRPQLEYGLAINRFTVHRFHALEEARNNCIRKIYGARGHQWYLLSRTSLWKTALSTTDEPDTRSFKAAKRRFLQQNLEICQQCRISKQLSHCRQSISMDPILWLPMSKSECSHCIRWRPGWIPGGKPRPCPKHPMQQLSKNHAISCLDMHQHLFMPEAVQDPLSFLLSMLSLRPSIPPCSALTWYQLWPIICSILHELDQLHHGKLIPAKHPYGQKPLIWLS